MLKGGSITFLPLCTLLPPALFLNKIVPYFHEISSLRSASVALQRSRRGGGRTVFLSRQPQAAWITTVFSFTCFSSETISHESIRTLESVPLKHFSEYTAS